MSRNLWLCAAAVLALAACDRQKGEAGNTVKVAAAAPPAAVPRPPTLAAPTEAVAASGAARVSATPAKAQPTRLRKAYPAAAKPQRSLSVAARRGERFAPTWRSEGVIAEGALAPSVAGYSAEYQACVARANGFTVARADCHSAELARQGARLDQIYAAVGHRARLDVTQKDWAERRDAGCREKAAQGGADLLAEGSCRLDMTIDRANGLVREAG
jgi:uncharacterized protein YecT (DUF1311 family)